MKVGAVPLLGIACVKHVAASPTRASLVVMHSGKHVIVNGARLVQRFALALGDLHGQVCGQEGVQHLIEIFDDIAEQAEKLYKAGVPAPEAAERYVIPEKFKTYGMYSWEFTLGSTVKKLYAEWKGK